MPPETSRRAGWASADLPLRFASDLIDRGAQPNREGTAAADHLAGIAAVLAALLGLLDVVRRTLTELVGVPGAIVQLVLALAALAGFAFIISARSAGPGAEPSYRFNRVTRWVAKLLTVALVVYALPRNISAVSDHFAQLPALFGGYLVDARTGEPIVDARVRVLIDGDVEVTADTWPSDSTGFYIVRTAREVPRRAAKLVVHATGCGTTELPVSREMERPPGEQGERSGGPRTTFRHAIACGGEP